MMLTFESARSAIKAAEEIQEALAERERAQPDETLRVRIGINVGEVLERDGHPFGAAVNAGARVMSKAGGGEILVSEQARQLAATVPGTTFRDRGRHGFKGFDEPWRLYQVEWPGSPPPPPRVRRKPTRRRTLVAGVVAGAAVARHRPGRAPPRSRRVEPPPTCRPTPSPRSTRRRDGSSPITRWATSRRRRKAATRASPTGPSPRVSGPSGSPTGADGTITRVDERTGERTTVTGVPGIKGLSVGAGRVWGAARDAGLVEVEPTGRVDNVQTVAVRRRPGGLGRGRRGWRRRST